MSAICLYCLFVSFGNFSANILNGSPIDNSFQVATNAKGRGVLRLLLLQQQINMLEVPVICLQLTLLAFPDWRAPVKDYRAFCTVFDIITRFTLMVRYMSNFVIALGRYIDS